MKKTFMELHREEIENNGYAIALVDGKIEPCSFNVPNEGDPFQCLKCEFDNGDKTCVENLVRWLMAEWR